MRKAGSLASFFVIITVAVTLIQTGCGHPTVLTGMTVTPTNSFVIGSGASVQYTCYGTFIHPAETRDITTKVTWTSSVPEVATVTNGLVTSGTSCGVTTITATAAHDLLNNGSSQGIMTATASFTVGNPNNDLCPKAPQ